ncbi:uncharacterized protein TRAVEDRAFT_42759 [Trametes versicolor FP-101664 SS1]|uniref:uncharacterized protein n=1 Tax=Trametes versicolor (strain FP-101664) TaxID=717944 RepID=UPI0004622349|nr:uncharacterized protein TRAVEDRAFT_42759 [Trametes versicolor FP-101664 SS1]EIW65389.1 hypothetical protein TRAVEDRAFT_42759 [Trametes versicolor FP-101664 SS1]
MSGKSVEIDYADTERRLVLSGAYVLFVAPANVIDSLFDAATLAGSMTDVGEVSSEVCTKSAALWNDLRAVGLHKHAHLRQMPL